MSDNNKDLIKIIWDIQNKLRNDEGITGIAALNQISFILLARTLTNEKCSCFGIPTELSWDSIKDLSSGNRFVKFYNPQYHTQCLFYHLRYNERWGLTKDIPFKIKNIST